LFFLHKMDSSLPSLMFKQLLSLCGYPPVDHVDIINQHPPLSLDLFIGVG